MSQSKTTEKNVCQNRKARHEYHVLESIECGIVLKGSEIKSVRNNKVSLESSYATITNGEVWLIDANIEPYKNATLDVHEPKRKRKLLLKKQQIEKFGEKAVQKGHTLIPLRMYIKEGFAKIELAVCKGKQLHDKRETEKKRDADREIRSNR